MLANVDSTQDLIQLLSSTPFAIQYLRQDNGVLQGILSRLKLRSYVDTAALRIPPPSPLELRQMITISPYSHARNPNVVLVQDFTLKDLTGMINDEIPDGRSGYWNLEIQTLGIKEDSLAVLLCDILDDDYGVVSFRFHKFMMHFNDDDDEEGDFHIVQYYPQRRMPEVWDWVDIESELGTKLNDQILNAAIEEWKYDTIQDFQKESNQAEAKYRWVMGYR